MSNWVFLLLGVLAAGVGGEFFVRGAVGLAAWSRVPAGIIGATVAAFATSTPELSVALNAATAGQPQLPVGDALGSNVTNIGLILGLAILVLPMAANRGDVRRDLPFALIAPAITGLLLLDGQLGRIDGTILLVAFGLWLAIVTRDAWHARQSAAAVIGEPRHSRALLEGLGGLALLVVAGRLIVFAASGIAEDIGVDTFIVGATMVAIGTSAPELATTLIASLRGHTEIGLGTLVGSNIFNNLWILGITALISPIAVVQGREVAIALAASAALLLLVIPAGAGVLGRRRGVALVSGYGGYLSLLFLWA